MGKTIAGIVAKKATDEFETQNMELCSIIQNGTEVEKRKAESQLVDFNNGLINKMMGKYMHLCKDTILEPEDLWNVAALGLLRAAKTYDAEKASFSTYAYWWMKQSVLRSLANEGQTVRIPLHAIELYYFARNKYKSESETSFERLVREDDKFTDTQKKLILDVFSVYVVKSLDEPICAYDDEVAPLGDFVAASNNVEDEVINNNLNRKIEELVETCLNEREKWVIEHRYGLRGIEWTLEKCGERYPWNKVTRERIRQIEKKAIEKLQKQAKQKGLDLYL